MTYTISVVEVSKRFALPKLPKHTTLKEHVTRGTMFRFDRGRNVVDALLDVSFTVAPGEMLGIIGRNGSGKTTLLRLLAGIYAPDKGVIQIAGNITPLLALGAGFHPDLTGRENARIELLALGIDRKRLDEHLDYIIEFSELGDFIDVPTRMYSSGMLTRLAFSAATSLELDVLLIDEALAVGDEAFAEKCLRRIDAHRTEGKSIVFVTHNTKSVLERCDTALWLDQGRVAALGNPPEVVSAYESALEAFA